MESSFSAIVTPERGARFWNPQFSLGSGTDDGSFIEAQRLPYTERRCGNNIGEGNHGNEEKYSEHTGANAFEWHKRHGFSDWSVYTRIAQRDPYSKDQGFPEFHRL
jgi:hypothetical protein